MNEKTMDSSNKYTVKNFALKNQKSGTWPSSESAIRALRNRAIENGFEKAFVTVGRRVLVDEERFWEAVANLQGNKNR